MRAGACPMQQALTAEAASIVKQAVTLARRRGHAQVTPLHVANTMLSSPTGLLRTACLQSHSHPLQCKALELCFNVALNRLPASTSTPMLTTHNHQPLLSNALVAAFKRAQAHQRRGSIENQQQPLLAVKVEIEQLIISILDDPSVSRVMREAGFSSTQVKNNVEQSVSLEICANPSVSKTKEDNSQFGMKLRQNQFNYVNSSSVISGLDQIRNEDVMSVVENMMNRRRRTTVIVGECVASSESVVRGVMAKVEKGDVPESLRNVRFITLPLYSFGHLSKDDVEQKLGELRCLLKNLMGRGVVLYLGDLKWTAELRANCSEQVRKYYCPVEHITMELGRYVSGIVESARLWLVGIATYQTYMRCRVGHPSLETILGLHPLPIPAGSLGLSLNPDSDLQVQLRTKTSDQDGSGWSLVDDTVEKQLTCCADCLAKFEIEARSLANSNSQESNLPSWLQQYKDENKRLTSNDPVRELCKKWNSLCSSKHKQQIPTEITLNFSSISPSSSLSYDQHFPNLNQTHQSWPMTATEKHPWRHQQFWISEKEPALLTLTNCTKQSHNSNPNSVTSSETMEMEIQRFKQFSAEGLKSLCNALEQKVAWQKSIIPEIASTVLQCRSGMMRRKGVKLKETKEDTCLIFQGGDTQGKENIARELANMVFGSENRFVSIGVCSYSSFSSDPNEEFRGKRCREESSSSYLEKFSDAISNNPHCVFFLDDIEQVDYYSQLGIKHAIERGRVRDSEGSEVGFRDAIIILSYENLDSRSRACSPLVKQKSEATIQEEKDAESSEKEQTTPCVSLDLNLSVEDNIIVDDEPSFDVELRKVVDRSFILEVQEVS